MSTYTDKRKEWPENLKKNASLHRGLDWCLLPPARARKPRTYEACVDEYYEGSGPDHGRREPRGKCYLWKKQAVPPHLNSAHKKSWRGLLGMQKFWVRNKVKFLYLISNFQLWKQVYKEYPWGREKQSIGTVSRNDRKIESAAKDIRMVSIRFHTVKRVNVESCVCCV